MNPQRGAHTIMGDGTQRIWTLLFLLLAAFAIGANICTNKGLSVAVAMLPVGIICCLVFFYNSDILFYLLFIYNYVIMGAIRYIYMPVPISSVTDVFLALLLLLLSFQYFQQRKSIVSKLPFVFLGIFAPWLGYALLQVFNDTTLSGVDYYAWYREVRPYGLHIIYIILVYAMVFTKFQKVKLLLIVWGVLSLLAGFKGYWQKSHGFDESELIWLWSVGAKTHFISTGIRYFSFFTDASNYGSNMAFTAATYMVCTIYLKGLHYKIFCSAVALAALYGVYISGTRSASITFYAGIVAYCFLCRDLRIFLASALGLGGFIFALLFTPFGESSPQMKRLKSAFDRNDASLNVRLDNQRAMMDYMKTAPFGIGLGKDGSNVPTTNKYWVLSVMAPDSSLVYFWIKTGKVGLTFFLFSSIMTLVVGSFISLFLIKDREVRGVSTAFVCGTACMLVAGYGNQVYFMLPNYILIYGCQTIVFLAPYLDKKKREEEALIAQNKTALLLPQDTAITAPSNETITAKLV